MDNKYIHQLRLLIHDYIKGYSVRVYLFGSRAKGLAREKSDVDIAILPLQSLPDHFFSHLKERIEASTIPYSVDIVNLSEVDDIFRAKIVSEGIEWKD